MRALDLFCGGGGASYGLSQAGFEVIGVDINSQPNYPFEFIKADALEVSLTGYDLIWASPPCQGYSNHVSSDNSPYVSSKGRSEPRLIANVRSRLVEYDTPYVIENVRGAKIFLRTPIELCGTMFGLPISRHRYFESSFKLSSPIHYQCVGVAKRYSEKMGWEYRDMSVTGKGRHSGTSERWKQIMGIEHDMTQSQIAESIPPAYARYIGEQFLNDLP
jgi:DNA (cytosine-5)-methyltransferase 1